jgi:hypothetical protein
MPYNFVTTDHTICDLKTEGLSRAIIICFQRRYKTQTATNFENDRESEKVVSRRQITQGTEWTTDDLNA